MRGRFAAEEAWQQGGGPTMKRARNFSAAAAQGVLAALVLTSLASVALAAPRVLPPDQRPNDRRLGPLKDLNGYFPMQVPETAEAWQARAEELRRQTQVALGLWPMPTKTPVQAVVHGTIEQDDYTVSKVYLQSFPGFYVTGNLYRPKERSGKHPGILCPHGHWPQGRFFDHGPQTIRRELDSGGEVFEEGGRSPLQARCVQLARMGCVVFHYDMLGYADSQQISFQVAHRFAKQSETVNEPDRWTLFSPQAELRLQNVMGLQTWNSIRALDWLESLPEVDPQRIAVTGASGGGTQTFILCAVDPRPAVSAPAVMVSTAMQGGCTCENATYLRVDTGNIELAGLFAPKPQVLTAADDWTKEIPTKGLPELKRLYELLGAPDRVTGQYFPFPHNYNSPSRHFVYEFLNRHLKLGQSSPIRERDYKRLTPEELTVWNAEHPKPPGGQEFEIELLKAWDEDNRKQLAALTPRGEESLDAFRRVVGGAFRAMIGRGLPAADQIEHHKAAENDRGNYLEFLSLVRYTPRQEELPVLFLYPKKWNKRVTVWIGSGGKAELLDDQGKPLPAIARLLEAGNAVVGADLLYQGEFLADGQPLSEAPVVGNPREFAGYTLGYNPPLFCQRVHDVLTLLSFVRHHETAPEHVELVGTGKGALWSATALAVAGQAVDRAALDVAGQRFAQCASSYRHPEFFPGALRYGDLPAVLALAAPTPIRLGGEAEVPPLAAHAYRAAGAAEAVTAVNGVGSAAIVDWLLKP